MRFQYAEQPKPEGLAQAYIIGAEFVASQSSALVLGDNLFYGHDLQLLVSNAAQQENRRRSSRIMSAIPSVMALSSLMAPAASFRSKKSLQKPIRSRWAVTGLYFYDAQVLEIAAKLKPSARGELEITDVNRAYLERGQLHVQSMGRGFAWLDTGTPDSLLEAAEFVRTLEKRQGFKVCCPEEIAFRQGWIDAKQLVALGNQIGKSEYGGYLLRLASHEM